MTVHPWKEPTTEAEAQALQRFLKTGADSTLTVLKTFETAPGFLTPPNSLVLSFPGTSDVRPTDPLTELALSLSIAPPEAPPGPGILVVVGDPDATAETATASTGFVGSVAFFGLGEAHAGHGDHDTPRFILPITRQVARSRPSVDLIITLIPTAIGTQDVLPGTRLDVVATLQLLQLPKPG